MGWAEDRLAEPIIRLGSYLGNILCIDRGVSGARLDLDEAHFIVVKWLCTPRQLLHIDNVVEKLLTFLHGSQGRFQSRSATMSAILLVGGTSARATSIYFLGQVASFLE